MSKGSPLIFSKHLAVSSQTVEISATTAAYLVELRKVKSQLVDADWKIRRLFVLYVRASILGVPKVRFPIEAQIFKEIKRAGIKNCDTDQLSKSLRQLKHMKGDVNPLYKSGQYLASTLLIAVDWNEVQFSRLVRTLEDSLLNQGPFLNEFVFRLSLPELALRFNWPSGIWERFLKVQGCSFTFYNEAMRALGVLPIENPFEQPSGLKQWSPQAVQSWETHSENAVQERLKGSNRYSDDELQRYLTFVMNHQMQPGQMRLWFFSESFVFQVLEHPNLKNDMYRVIFFRLSVAEIYYILQQPTLSEPARKAALKEISIKIQSQSLRNRLSEFSHWQLGDWALILKMDGLSEGAYRTICELFGSRTRFYPNTMLVWAVSGGYDSLVSQSAKAIFSQHIKVIVADIFSNSRDQETVQMAANICNRYSKRIGWEEMSPSAFTIQTIASMQMEDGSDFIYHFCCHWYRNLWNEPLRDLLLARIESDPRTWTVTVVDPEGKSTRYLIDAKPASATFDYFKALKDNQQFEETLSRELKIEGDAAVIGWLFAAAKCNIERRYASFSEPFTLQEAFSVFKWADYFQASQTLDIFGTLFDHPRYGTIGIRTEHRQELRQAHRYESVTVSGEREIREPDTWVPPHQGTASYYRRHEYEEMLYTTEIEGYWRPGGIVTVPYKETKTIPIYYQEKVSVAYPVPVSGFNVKNFRADLQTLLGQTPIIPFLEKLKHAVVHLKSPFSDLWLSEVQSALLVAQQVDLHPIEPCLRNQADLNGDQIVRWTVAAIQLVLQSLPERDLNEIASVVLVGSYGRREGAVLEGRLSDFDLVVLAKGPVNQTSRQRFLDTFKALWSTQWVLCPVVISFVGHGPLDRIEMRRNPEVVYWSLAHHQVIFGKKSLIKSAQLSGKIDRVAVEKWVQCRRKAIDSEQATPKDFIKWVLAIGGRKLLELNQVLPNTDTELLLLIAATFKQFTPQVTDILDFWDGKKDLTDTVSLKKFGEQLDRAKYPSRVEPSTSRGRK